MNELAVNPKWREADRISDRLVDLFNDEIYDRKTSPAQVLAGFLLAFCALARTMPPDNMPPSLAAVISAIHQCLASMIREDASVY